jgi:hypothetical protein
MRNVSFSVLGGVGGSTEKQGTVADLLDAIPYFLSAQLIPPLLVVNDLLRKGIRDAGMSGGCMWEPFEITQSEWADLANNLKALTSGKECRFVEPPEWVKTIDDWNAWIMIFKYGYPEEFRDIEKECRDLERARKQATKDGNTDLAEALRVRAIKADIKLAQFAMKHHRKKKK